MIQKMVKKTLGDTFLKNNLIFFIGSLSVSALNYLYHPFLGRILNSSDFGEVQAIISLFMQLSIITSVFGIITTHIVANKEERGDKTYIIVELQRIALAITGFLCFIIFIFSGTISQFFQFSSPTPFLILAVLLPIGASIGLRTAVLQGNSKFGKVSVINIIGAAFKLFIAVGLVILGMRTFGAILGLLIAQIFALTYAYTQTYKELPTVRLNIPLFGKTSNKIENKEIKEDLMYGAFVLIMLLAATFFFTSDVVIIKKFFSPETAGLYSGVATIARIVFFATTSVAGVLLPAVKMGKTSENVAIFKKSLLIVLAISVPAMIVFSIFPSIVISTLLGKKFLPYSSLLPLLSLSITLAAITNLVFYYYIALRKYSVAPIAVLGVIIILVLSWFNHDSISQIVINFLIGNVIVLTTLIFRAGLINDQQTG